MSQTQQVEVLIVFANPRGTDALRLGSEDRAIRQSIKLSRYRDNISLTTCHAATVHDLRRALLEGSYQVVHISGHGTDTGLVLEDELGGQYIVPQHALADLFGAYSPPLKCVVLNACFSISQGELTSMSVPFTVAMEGSIGDEAAIEFSRGFYDAIGAGKDIEFAYQEGCRTARLAAPDSQFISNIIKQGENWFLSQLPPNWILQPSKTDSEVDGVIVISDKSELNGREFRVKIDVIKEPTISNSMFIIPDIKRSSIEHWFLSPLPTLLVIYDATRKDGFFRWHSDLYDEVRDILGRKETESISISVPMSNRLNQEGWGTIRDNLKWHYHNLSDALNVARNSRSLLPTIHNLASAIRQLNSIDHQPIPITARTQEQEGILALMEMMQHRLIVSTLTDLLSELDRETEGAQRLQAWIDSYASKVSSAFPNFAGLTDWKQVSPDFELAYAKDLIHPARPKLMELVLEMIMLLAPGQFNRPEAG